MSGILGSDLGVLIFKSHCQAYDLRNYDYFHFMDQGIETHGTLVTCPAPPRMQVGPCGAGIHAFNSFP